MDQNDWIDSDEPNSRKFQLRVDLVDKEYGSNQNSIGGSTPTAKSKSAMNSVLLEKDSNYIDNHSLDDIKFNTRQIFIAKT